MKYLLITLTLVLSFNLKAKQVIIEVDDTVEFDSISYNADTSITVHVPKVLADGSFLQVIAADGAHEMTKRGVCELFDGRVFVRYKPKFHGNIQNVVSLQSNGDIDFTTTHTYTIDNITCK